MSDHDEPKTSKSLPIFSVLLILLGGMLFSCQKKPAAPLRVPDFDAGYAYRMLVKQVEFGPRVPGTRPHELCLQFLEDSLKKYADKVVRQSFDYTVQKTGQTVRLTNLIGSFGLKPGPRVLLAAHWDSRPWADQDPDSANRNKPIPAANDGASGVAVLLEIARILKATPPAIGVDIVFFDGEDLGSSGYPETYAAGSQYFAKHKDIHYNPFLGILLDMVGDKDLRIYKEVNSVRYAPAVVDVVWNYAARLNISSFINETRHEISDDHVPLLKAGIPCIDLIDFDYPYWHTLEDTPDKCSPQSLEKVGKVVLAVVYNPPT
ncbi:MAG: M28 family peptidase [Calditrichaeota bacterium]|nr:MAG: M28 family peptidase [Calditrichota bacterium]